MALAAVGALFRKRRDKKFGDGFGGFGIGGNEIGRQATFEPGKHAGGLAAWRSLKVRNDDDFEFETFGAVNRHELNAAIAAGGGIGLRFEIVEGRSERGARKIGLALGERVEALPEKVEIRASFSVDALRAAKLEPDLLKPGAQRGCGLRGAKALSGLDCAQNTIDSEMAFVADEVRAFASEFEERAARAVRASRRW